jgi:hypothetical protein
MIASARDGASTARNLYAEGTGARELTIDPFG